MNDIDRTLRMLNEQFPLEPHTNAGRRFSTVRRMKAEKDHGIPIERRSGFSISIEKGRLANELAEPEWEAFYSALSGQLERDYPKLHRQMFHVS